MFYRGLFCFNWGQFRKAKIYWNGLWILDSKSENYVSVVVFYSADCNNLLPVVLNTNDRRYFYYDE
jgi:hypothetical protein